MDLDGNNKEGEAGVRGEVTGLYAYNTRKQQLRPLNFEKDGINLGRYGGFREHDYGCSSNTLV